jgi:hypothetical protein
MVPGYRSRELGLIPGPTRFSEKYSVWKAVHSASRVQLRERKERKKKKERKSSDSGL